MKWNNYSSDQEQLPVSCPIIDTLCSLKAGSDVVHGFTGSPVWREDDLLPVGVYTYERVCMY